MKKILSLLLVAGMFAFVACSEEAATEDENTEQAPTGDEAAPEDNAAPEDDAAMEEDAEANLPDHVCGEKCTDGCVGPCCGEKGHECSDACMAEADGADAGEISSEDSEMDV